MNVFGDNEEALTREDIDDAGQEWFLMDWLLFQSILTFLGYPTVSSFFCIILGMFLCLSNKLWMFIIGFVAMLLSAALVPFQSYDIVFVNLFTFYPIPSSGDWQWIVGAEVLYVALLFVLILRYAKKTELSTSKLLSATFYFRRQNNE
eukprot:gnl/Chilomastix_cuspidata/4436.p1 GENE.gnl/Chilomastix_cuspidata/4436~~gnl/Chilomastix_cuspidata/4436.p1  ORF type:complete len:148 (-),score=23.76 gnl/Chilomastix_cuspidata/4436:87-530(-)